MYQNIFVEHTQYGQIVHVWDDITGHIEFPYKKYAYKKSDKGTYMSMYGDKLEKVYKFDYTDPTLFESDVLVETRTLIDMYEDSDEVSINHHILNFDIEVSMIGVLPDPKTAKNEITAISIL